MPSSVAVIISADVAASLSLSAGKFCATGKDATRLNTGSAKAGKAADASKAAVNATLLTEMVIENPPFQYQCRTVLLQPHDRRMTKPEVYIGKCRPMQGC